MSEALAQTQRAIAVQQQALQQGHEMALAMERHNAAQVQRQLRDAVGALRVIRANRANDLMIVGVCNGVLAQPWAQDL